MKTLTLPMLAALLALSTAMPSMAQDAQAPAADEPAMEIDEEATEAPEDAMAEEGDMAPASDRPTAAATFVGLDGEVLGSATFRDTPHGVLMRVTVEGLPPGELGLHIHETGECDGDAAFESAGGHFNPTGAEHGFLNDNGPHAGDLPSQWVSEAGVMEASLYAPSLSLIVGDNAEADSDRHPIVSGTMSTAIMIHDHGDDYMSDPAGESGGRIACGVIELSPPFGS